MEDWIKSDWVKSDLASWLAFLIAVAAVLAWKILRPPGYAELSNLGLALDTDSGKVTLSVDLTSESHAAKLNARAKLRIGGMPVTLTLEPLTTPTNYDFRAVNTLKLVFTGVYLRQEKEPTEARIDIRARFSDGSNAKLRSTMPLVKEANSPTPPGTATPPP